MKKISHVLFGVLSSFLVIILATVIVAVTGEHFFIFNIFFFVPIGTILLGIVANIGVKRGMIHGDISYSKKLRILPIALSIICFIGIYFFIYKITYISPDMQLNYEFDGQHVSSFLHKDTLEHITFSKYLSVEVLNRDYDFYFTFGNSGVTVPLNTYTKVTTNSSNWLWFIFEGLGFIAGGIFIFDTVKDERYCKDCKKYFKTKKLFVTSMNDFEQRLEEFNNCLEEGDSLKNFINSLDKLSITNRKSHTIATIVFCPTCSKGILYVKYKRRSGLGFEDVPLKMKKYELNPSVLSTVINS